MSKTQDEFSRKCLILGKALSTIIFFRKNAVFSLRPSYFQSMYLASDFDINFLGGL